MSGKKKKKKRGKKFQFIVSRASRRDMMYAARDRKLLSRKLVHEG